MIRVVPLGSIPTSEGLGHALLALLPDGSVDVDVQASWVAAAAALALRHRGRAIACDASLETVARRHGWTLIEQLDEALLRQRAVIALSFFARFPPQWKVEVESFIEAWRAFFPLRLWEDMPAEMALPLIRRVGGRGSRHLVATLGQGGQAFGLAFYESPEDFDGVFNGVRPEGSTTSVLADHDEPMLKLAFDALRVPAPILVTAEKMQRRPVELDDVVLMTGVMNLLTGLPTGVLAVSLGPDSTLALERKERPRAPKSTTPSKSKVTSRTTPPRAKPRAKPKPKRS